MAEERDEGKRIPGDMKLTRGGLRARKLGRRDERKDRAETEKSSGEKEAKKPRMRQPRDFREHAKRGNLKVELCGWQKVRLTLRTMTDRSSCPYAGAGKTQGSSRRTFKNHVEKTSGHDVHGGGDRRTPPLRRCSCGNDRERVERTFNGGECGRGRPPQTTSDMGIFRQHFRID